MLKRILTSLTPLYSLPQQQNAVYKPNPWLFVQLFQLLSLTAIIWLLKIEQDKGFDRVVFIITASFLVYTIVSLKYRKLFLLLLSCGLLFFLLGFKIAPTVLGTVMLFLGVTYITKRWLRILATIILTLAVIVLAHHVIVSHILAIALYYAALFLMIRFIYLLYEIKFIGNEFGFIDRLNYLLIIPNICFPLFPPLDPKAYLSSYYSIPANETLQKALIWITRGVFHTLLYRIIYMFYTPSAYEITDFYSLLQFTISGYFLIVRMSGLFYISLGFFTLFGFNCPPLFNNYFFTSGFSDLWRRVNLYWSGFLSRVIYFPMLFSLKKLSMIKAMLWSTLALFLFSWLLHSWQWYWIKGKYVFSWNDFVFWNFLGVVIFTHAYWRIKNNNRVNKVGFKHSIWHATKVIGMFFLMGVLWTMWTSQSLREWMYIMSFANNADPWQYMLFIGCFLVLIIIGAFVHYSYVTKQTFQFVFNDHKPITGLLFTVFLLVLAAYSYVDMSNSSLGKVMSMNLNQRDKATMERGYYEQLLNNERQRIELMDAIANRPGKWNIDPTAYKPREDELKSEFKPNVVTTFKGDTLRINSFGIRDQEYAIKKPSNVTRAIVLGGSYEMGSGVSNDENFPALVEQMLNRKMSDSIEILNFAIGGYHLIQSTFTTTRRIEKFQPDIVIYVAHSQEVDRCLEGLVNLLERNKPLTLNYLKKLVKKAGIKPYMCTLEKYNRLKPFAKELIQWGYGAIANWCKQNNVLPVWVYLPASVDLRDDIDRDFCFKTAQNFNFTILDIKDVYKGHKATEIQLNEWDTHPNEKGHRIIAAALYRAIVENNTIFKNKK